MNLTQINNRIDEIDAILQDNSARRTELAPVLSRLETELEECKGEMSWLSSQWNNLVREEKQLQSRKGDIEERDARIKQDELYTEALEAYPNFYEAMKEPLDKYIQVNHSNWLGFKKMNTEDVIKDIENRVEDYKKPGTHPNLTMAEIIDCMGAYRTLTKAKVKLELDKPENWELDINTNNFRIENNFNSLFSTRAFKSQILKVD